MRRIKLIIAYDGTAYCGWQLQPTGITIEEVLNKTLTELLKEPITVIGASRTDSGVHALGNVAVFDTTSRIQADKICMALNQKLPEDIRVQSSMEVEADWHPRRQNCTKTYEYKILNRKINIPICRLYSHFCYFNLDLEKMRQGAALLVGEHDFQSFCTVRTQAVDTVRTIYDLSLEKDTNGMITMRISGSGFLYNMVRIIAGTLIKVGMGFYLPEYVEEILDARDRQKAGPTAPARGLTLISLNYETEPEQTLGGCNKDWNWKLFQRELPECGRSLLVIERCEERDYPRLLERMIHRAFRNGATQVYLCDLQQSLRPLQKSSYGYYEVKKPELSLPAGLMETMSAENIAPLCCFRAVKQKMNSEIE